MKKTRKQILQRRLNSENLNNMHRHGILALNQRVREVPSMSLQIITGMFLSRLFSYFHRVTLSHTALVILLNLTVSNLFVTVFSCNFYLLFFVRHPFFLCDEFLEQAHTKLWSSCNLSLSFLELFFSLIHDNFYR